MKRNRILIMIIIISLLLFGCKDSSQVVDNSNESSVATEGVSETEEKVTADSSDMFTNRDFEIGYDEKECAKIILSGSAAACDSESVVIDGSSITITDEGSYIITGELDDGMIIIDAESTDKPQLIFDNVNIASSKSAALYVKEADKVFVTLADDSQNFLENGGEFDSIDDNNIDGTIFSKQDITFNGNGTLEVTSPSGHGITCKDDLVFTSGSYTIASSSHGLDVNDSVRIANAELEISAGKDGIHVENADNTEKGFIYFLSGTTNITAEGDGMSAGLYSEILGGEINITSGGGSVNASKTSSDNYGGFMGGMGGKPSNNNYSTSDDDSVSMKGIKADSYILINSCDITIDSADDSVHSNTSVTVSGGTLNLSSGDDAIHAEETLTINGGEIEVTESYEGLEALDILINEGDISLVSSDDGLNAAGGTDESGYGGRDDGNFGGRGGMGGFGGQGSSNGSIVINGGNLYIEASGDGIDANGDLEITGGYITVCGPTQGDTAVLDYDNTAKISGGTFIGTGSYMMAQTFSSSENQGVLALSVGNQNAATEITITDSKGNEILKYSPKLSYAIMIFSSPEIETGESYQISVGSQTGEFTAS